MAGARAALQARDAVGVLLLGAGGKKSKSLLRRLRRPLLLGLFLFLCLLLPLTLLALDGVSGWCDSEPTSPGEQPEQQQTATAKAALCMAVESLRRSARDVTSSLGVQNQPGGMEDGDEERWLLEEGDDVPNVAAWKSQWERRNLTMKGKPGPGPGLRPNLTVSELKVVDTKKVADPDALKCSPRHVPVILSVGEHGTVACPALWECKTGQVGLRAVCGDPTLVDEEDPVSLPTEGGFTSLRLGERAVGKYVAQRGGFAFLAHVYTNKLAQVFDSSQIFLKGGCWEVEGRRPLVRDGHQVVDIPAAITLASGHANSQFHGLVELLPRIALLLPAIRAFPRAGILVSEPDVAAVSTFFRLLGEPEPDPGRVRLLGDRDLVRAEVLVVAQGPPCGRASGSLWRRIRRAHFRVGRTRWGGAGWYVVVEERKGSRGLVQHERILAGLVAALGAARVRVFSDRVNWSMEATRELFSQATVMLGPHGAGLSNMVFMPHAASVVEVRPSNFSNPCYHSLADALRFNYYRIDAPGVKSSRMDVDVEATVALVASIVRARGRPVPFYPQLVTS